MVLALAYLQARRKLRAQTNASIAKAVGEDVGSTRRRLSSAAARGLVTILPTQGAEPARYAVCWQSVGINPHELLTTTQHPSAPKIKMDSDSVKTIASGSPCSTDVSQNEHDAGQIEPVSNKDSRPRPRATSFPYFLSYSFNSDEHRLAAQRVMDSCGPGAAPPEDEDAYRSLFLVLPLWLSKGYTLEEIVAVVIRKTCNERKRRDGSPNPLRDFTLLTENIAAEHERLSRSKASPRSQASTSRDRRTKYAMNRERTASSFELSKQSISQRKASLRNLIAGLKDGNRQASFLPAHQRYLRGADLDQAYDALQAKLEKDLRELEQREPDYD